jgi:lysozyme
MTEIRAIPQVAFEITRDKERRVLFAYDDHHFPPRPAKPEDHIEGTLTAGYGHTGPDVLIGMTVTDDLAEDWLSQDLQEAAEQLTKKIGSDVVDELTSNQYAALLDFVITAGVGDPKKPEWTIWRRLRARAYDQVPQELAKFVNTHIKRDDGTVEVVKVNGLVDRRNAEIGLWAVSEPGTVDRVVPSSVTRLNPAPPTPQAPGRSKALIMGTIGAVAGAGPTIDQVSHVIAPYAHRSHYVEGALGVLAALAAICAVVGIFFIRQQARNARN